MKAKLLAALRRAEGYVSGQELCEALGVSRTAVWKVMRKLKEEGYQIEAIPNKGYCLLDSPDILSVDELYSVQNTAWAGQKIVYYDVTDSTNIQAKRLAEEGAPHGTLVVAGRQDAGRGRRGRSWESPKDDGIFMTILLRPEIRPDQAPMLTLVAALAVAKAIRQTLNLSAMIKWPNDVLLNGKKICGILTELSAEITVVNYLVIGVGINVYNKRFEGELASVATSIAIESGRKIRRAELVAAVWEAFEAYYDKFTQKGDLSLLKKEYHSCLVNRERQVRVLDPKDPFTGTAKGITAGGELMVETESGIRNVSSGEVSVRGIYGYI